MIVNTVTLDKARFFLLVDFQESRKNKKHLISKIIVLFYPSTLNIIYF